MLKSHEMKLSFRQLNLITGWLTFGIALFTYVSTLAPTVSFWDCGEYIATSIKLQVGHPPGAPVFQLVGNVFSQLALGDVERQAFYVNLVSGLSSAFTIPFLFWTIVALGRKLFQTEILSKGQEIVLLGAGAVGALAFTFSDTFWFSAVEGEVYAMSSCFTAIAFWAVLKWEAAVDSDPYANRWLLLIAYLTGLSVGVHILVFLTIPSVVMIYFYKKYPNRNWGSWIVANVAAVGVLGLVFAIIIPFILWSLGKFEINAVNSLGMPQHTGTILTLVLLGTAVFFGIRWTKKHNRPLVAQAIQAVVFLLIGYSSFAVLAIRSNANTPIDENNPEDAMALLAYYNREQYGDWPVLYGESFNSQLDQGTPYVDGDPSYQFNEETKQYEVVDPAIESIPNFREEDQSFFPRMWSRQHVGNYIELMDIKDPMKKLEFKDHFSFFMDYQVGQMWFRYFMWNFAGRQNDDQNKYELTKGNWITGISFIDEMRLGPQANQPDHFLNNPSRNVYYALPLILGLIGLYFQIRRDRDNAWVVGLLFLFTGLAIVVYTNHKPFEPRERDYAFVGSFYVFAIWIGLGVIALYEWLGKYRNELVAGVLSLVMLGIPTLMAAENWDDHDRSDRFVAREVAKMYLDSCEPNAILFTNGDNDTFPLWYIQEVEGYRTDVRIVNLSLLNTDWYIDMMKRKFYDSDPIPVTLTKKEYVQGTRDILYVADNIPGLNNFLIRNWGINSELASTFTGTWDLKSYMDNWVHKPKNMITTSGGSVYRNLSGSSKEIQFSPTNKFKLPIDRQAVLEHEVVALQDSARIVDEIRWNWNDDVIMKRDLILMDLLANNDWSRPIYFSTTVGYSPKDFFWLHEYLRQEGLVYRFVPVRTPAQNNEFGSVDTEKMYNLMYNPENEPSKFNFGNMEKPGVFLDETVRRSSYSIKQAYARLATALGNEGQRQKALQVLDFARAKMPFEKTGNVYFELPLLQAYYTINETEAAEAIQADIEGVLYLELDYYKGYMKDREHFESIRLKEAYANVYVLSDFVKLSYYFNSGKLPEVLQMYITFKEMEMQSDGSEEYRLQLAAQKVLLKEQWNSLPSDKLNALLLRISKLQQYTTDFGLRAPANNPQDGIDLQLADYISSAAADLMSAAN